MNAAEHTFIGASPEGHQRGHRENPFAWDGLKVTASIKKSAGGQGNFIDRLQGAWWNVPNRSIFPKDDRGPRKPGAVENLSVEKQMSIKSLVLSRGGHFFANRQMGQESLDFGDSHFQRLTFVVEENDRRFLESRIEGPATMSFIVPDCFFLPVPLPFLFPRHVSVHLK